MIRSLFPLALVGVGLGGLLGCAKSLAPDPVADTAASVQQVVVDGVVELLLDATDEYAWVPYSFADAAVVDEGLEHVRFQRYRVALAEGTSVARLPGADLDEPIDLGALEWLSDAAAPVEDEDYAMFEWYAYDHASHTLAPKDERYVFRLSEGAEGYVVLVFDDYYDDAGTPARLSMRWTSVTEAR